MVTKSPSPLGLEVVLERGSAATQEAPGSPVEVVTRPGVPGTFTLLLRNNRKGEGKVVVDNIVLPKAR